VIRSAYGGPRHPEKKKCVEAAVITQFVFEQRPASQRKGPLDGTIAASKHAAEFGEPIRPISISQAQLFCISFEGIGLMT
jgi:hypothetical protein